MRRGRLVLFIVLGVALLGAAGFGLFFAIAQRTAPPSPVDLVPTTWKTARETPMHMMHVAEKKIACTECHSSPFPSEASPSPPPTEAVCTKCHGDEQTTHHRGAPANAKATTTCLSCHVFGAEKAVAQCNDCHDAKKRAAGAPPLEHHVAKGMPCNACHVMHSKDGAAAAAVATSCTTCHATSATHGMVSAHTSRKNVDPAAAEPIMELAITPAIVAFARGEDGGGGAKHPQQQDASADAAAVLTYAQAKAAAAVCTTCHAPHAGKEAARSTCEGCHVRAHASNANANANADARPPGAIPVASTTTAAVAAPMVVPHGPRIAGHQACLTCHEPHKARRADVRPCVGCHADHRAVAETPAGHANCKGCHTPHAPTEAKASCTSTCHSAVKTIASDRVAPHAQCSSCHDPHRPAASPGQACVRCHESTKPGHPPAPAASSQSSTRDRGPCIGCHAPHGGAPGGPTRANVNAALAGTSATTCSSCHTKAKDDHALHAKGVACTQCHKPHAFKLTVAAASPQQLCSTCHAAKTAAVSTRPGHINCNGCHGAPHSPTAKPSCEKCHSAESHSASKGHATCTSCHDAHSGSLGSRAECTSCHANKKGVLHAKLSKPITGSAAATGAPTLVHSSAGESCATCHRAHGPKGVEKPAPCTTCHAKPSLSGLHSKSAHGKCETCHSAHVPTRSDRATCTSACHTDQRNHQPTATSCKGCHLFRQ